VQDLTQAGPECLDRTEGHHRDSPSVIGLNSFATRHETADLESQTQMTDRNRVHVVAAAKLIGEERRRHEGACGAAGTS
jgi:hypothetical protein